MTMANKRLLLHPAADIFRNHLLSEVENENEKLREDNKRLEPARNFLAKIDIHLRDGRVVTTVLKHSAMNIFEYYSSIPIISGPFPLSECSSGKVTILGQIIGCFPGNNHLVSGICMNGNIVMRFSLSEHCAIEGTLRGLSDEDYCTFKKTSFTGRTSPITLYLTKGIGLQNPAAIIFIPSILLLGVNSEFRRTLKLLDPLPSHETIQNGVAHYLSNPCSNVLFVLLPPGFSSSDGLRLAVAKALGHTDSQVELLAANYSLRNEHSRLMQIQEMIGKLEIYHPAFSTRLSLKDGELIEGSSGAPLWQIICSETVKQGSLTGHNINSSLALFHSGMRLARENIQFPFLTRSVTIFGVKFGGAHISGFAHHHTSGVSSENIDIILYLNFPLSCVKNILDVMGVETR